MSNAQYVADIARWSSTYGAAKVQQAAAFVRTPLGIAQANYAIASTADIGDELFGSSDLVSTKPDLKIDSAFKDSWLHEPGGSW